MRRYLLLILCLGFLTTSDWGEADDLHQYLQEHYSNKIFIIRNFLSGNRLSYDSLGSPTTHAAAGDWTETAFVRIGDDPHIEKNRLVLNALRMVALSIDKRFQLRPMQDPRKANKRRGPGFLELEIELSGTPSSQSVDAVLNKVFLNAQDSFVDLVPEYWKACVSSGLAEKNANCLFAPEIVTISGVIPTQGPQPKEILIRSSDDGIFHVGGGVSAPWATYTPQPQLSEASRALQVRGTCTLVIQVNKDGSPSNLRIFQPLGAGLDLRAVQAVQNFKFEPAKKHGEPVTVEIAVEVDFLHL